MNQKRKILFLVTEDWYFWSHRLPLARQARQKGYSVIVATRVQAHGQRILDEGFQLIPIGMLRRSKNLLNEFRSILELIRIYRTERPDIVHHVALKPIVYGSLAARITGVPRVVNALAGMGYVFTTDNFKTKLLRPVIKLFLNVLFDRPNTRIILQNPDDRDMLIKAGIVRGELTRLIRGSGVDPQTYFPTPEPEGMLTVVMASRMLWDKGIKEFVDAAHLLRAEQVNARFVLVGDNDEHNPASVSTAQLTAWNMSGDVEWWGKHDNMPSIFAQSHIICLPSYREGVPKVLIEAAACGRPIVTTNAPGCREIVRDTENGFLVPIRDHISLAHALRKLINEPSLRKKMGARGREIVLNEFTVDKVVDETLSLYSGLFQ